MVEVLVVAVAIAPLGEIAVSRTTRERWSPPTVKPASVSTALPSRSRPSLTKCSPSPTTNSTSAWTPARTSPPSRDDRGIGADTLIDALVGSWSPAIDNVGAAGLIAADQADASTKHAETPSPQRHLGRIGTDPDVRRRLTFDRSEQGRASVPNLGTDLHSATDGACHNEEPSAATSVVRCVACRTQLRMTTNGPNSSSLARRTRFDWRGRSHQTT